MLFSLLVTHRLSLISTCHQHIIERKSYFKLNTWIDPSVYWSTIYSQRCRRGQAGSSAPGWVCSLQGIQWSPRLGWRSMSKSTLNPWQPPDREYFVYKEAKTQTQDSDIIYNLPLTVCLPGGLDLWNLLTSAQMRLMAIAQAMTMVRLNRVRNIRGQYSQKY